MKYLLICATLLCFSCGEVKKDQQTETSGSASENVETKSPAPAINTNDYRSLFDRELKDCNLISSAQIAQILEIAADNVTAKESYEGLCTFEVTLADGTSSGVRLSVSPLPKSDVRREIENYKAGTGGLEHYTSDNGDVDLCIHPYQGRLHLYHPGYDNGISISYGTALSLKGMNKQQKAARKSNALKIANFIVEQHKK